MFDMCDGHIAVRYMEDDPLKFELYSNINVLITSNELFSVGYNLWGHRILVTTLGVIRVPSGMVFSYYPKHKRFVITYSGVYKRYKTVTLSSVTTLRLVKSFIERIFKEDELYKKHYYGLRNNNKNRYVDGNLIPKHIRYKRISNLSWGVYGYNPFDETLTRLTSVPKNNPMKAPRMISHSKTMMELENKYRWRKDDGLVILKNKPI